MSRLTNTKEDRKGQNPFSYWLKDSHPLGQLEAIAKLADYEDKEEQGLLLFNPEELKTAIIDRMQEFRDEYKQYSESAIDHFGGKSESMEVAMRIVKGAFEEALAKMGGK